MSKTAHLPPQEPPRQRAPTRWVCLGLAGVVLLLYGQVAGHEFAGFDDDRYIFANPHVRQGLTWEGVKWTLSGFRVMNWHPLTWLSHMLDAQLFGLEPAGHLLTNVALHAATAVFLFIVLQQMTGTLWPCAFAAALFAVRPMGARRESLGTSRTKSVYDRHRRSAKISTSPGCTQLLPFAWEIDES